VVPRRPRELPLTNPDKVLYPAVGFRKRDVAAYYRAVAPALLPHLRGRPLTLKRYPNGVDAPFFYEKRSPAHRPVWVKTVPVRSGAGRESNDEYIDFTIVDDLPTLLWVANLASLELHTSMARARTIDTPTMVVFDLDPGPPAGLVDCARVALDLRGLLERLDLASLVKTSGGKGLQIYVPLNRAGVTHDETKRFAHALALLLERAEPERVVSSMKKALRPGKVLIDWSQNDRSKTTVCVYSLRARERPFVSTPVSWDEVARCARAGDAARLVFDAPAALARVAKLGDLFAPALARRQRRPALDAGAATRPGRSRSRRDARPPG
jgi:bifunctional non-homologous end joining protein LigD